jgi:excisionase family DNA binding protein
MKAPRKTTVTRETAAGPALMVSIDVDPLIEAVRRRVKLSERDSLLIKGDFARLLRQPQVRTSTSSRRAALSELADEILSTQQAADLLGVSRPYIAARIDAGDIPLHQQVGNQRRVMKSAVQAWHRRERTRQQRALKQLGADLDDEILSRDSR